MSPAWSHIGVITSSGPARIAAARRILTLSQLAAYMGVPRRRLYRLIATHRGVPVFKSGRHWCADIDAFRDWLLLGFDKDQAELSNRDKRRKPRPPDNGSA